MRPDQRREEEELNPDDCMWKLHFLIREKFYQDLVKHFRCFGYPTKTAQHPLDYKIYFFITNMQLAMTMAAALILIIINNNEEILENRLLKILLLLMVITRLAPISLTPMYTMVEYLRYNHKYIYSLCNRLKELATLEILSIKWIFNPRTCKLIKVGSSEGQNFIRNSLLARYLQISLIMHIILNTYEGKPMSWLRNQLLLCVPGEAKCRLIIWRMYLYLIVYPVILAVLILPPKLILYLRAIILSPKNSGRIISGRT